MSFPFQNPTQGRTPTAPNIFQQIAQMLQQKQSQQSGPPIAPVPAVTDPFRMPTGPVPNPNMTRPNQTPGVGTDFFRNVVQAIARSQGQSRLPQPTPQPAPQVSNLPLPTLGNGQQGPAIPQHDEFAKRAAAAMLRGMKPADTRFSGLTLNEIQQRAGITSSTTAPAAAEQQGNLNIPTTQFDASWIDQVPTTFVQQSLEANDGPSIARLILRGNGYAEDSGFGQWFVGSIGNQLIDMYARDAALTPDEYVTDYTGILEYGQGMLEHYLTPGGDPVVNAASSQMADQGSAIIGQVFNNPESPIAQAIVAQMATTDTDPNPQAYNPADVLYQRIFQPNMRGATATAQSVMQAQLDNAYKDYHLDAGLGYNGSFLDYIRDQTTILRSFQ